MDKKASMDTVFTTAREALNTLSAHLRDEPIPVVVEQDAPEAKPEEWAGADVVITSEQPQIEPDGFYPAPRFVVTPYAAQLSWLFFRLRDAFHSLYDGNSKIELFGRLANAALRYQAKSKGLEDQRELCFAVLHEAYAILEDMEEGTFEYLSVAFGNEIADDYIERAERKGFIGVDETRVFFAQMGVDL